MGFAFQVNTNIFFFTFQEFFVLLFVYKKLCEKNTIFELKCLTQNTCVLSHFIRCYGAYWEHVTDGHLLPMVWYDTVWCGMVRYGKVCYSRLRQYDPPNKKTAPHSSSPHLTAPHRTSQHLTAPHHNAQYCTSPHLCCTLPYLASPQFVTVV